AHSRHRPRTPDHRLRRGRCARAFADLCRQRHHQHHAPGSRRPAGTAEGAVRWHRAGARALPAGCRRGGDRVRQCQPPVHAAARAGARRVRDGAGGLRVVGGRVHRLADEAGDRRLRPRRQVRSAGNGQAPPQAARHSRQGCGRRIGAGHHARPCRPIDGEDRASHLHLAAHQRHVQGGADVL
ncbi:MAG: RuvC, partial [uncultured Ramlibacter sp.]